MNGTSADVRAAIEALTGDADPDIRASDRRAMVNMREPSEDVLRFLGEDGVARQPTTTSMASATFARLLSWLIRLAVGGTLPREGHVVAGQLNRLLDWETKPTPTSTDIWQNIPGVLEGSLHFPSAVADAAWAHIDSPDPLTRGWAAMAWAMCARRQPAENQLRILFGDTEESVRLSGLLAIQPLDVGSGRWIAEAVEPSFRNGDASAWEVMLSLPDVQGDAEFWDGVGAMLLRILDGGGDARGAEDLLMIAAGKARISGEVVSDTPLALGIRA